MKIRKGDRVVCVWPAGPLKKGGVYVIIDFAGDDNLKGFVNVQDLFYDKEGNTDITGRVIGDDSGWLISRFKITRSTLFKRVYDKLQTESWHDF